MIFSHRSKMDYSQIHPYLFFHSSTEFCSCCLPQYKTNCNTFAWWEWAGFKRGSDPFFYLLSRNYTTVQVLIHFFYRLPHHYTTVQGIMWLKQQLFSVPAFRIVFSFDVSWVTLVKAVWLWIFFKGFFRKPLTGRRKTKYPRAVHVHYFECFEKQAFKRHNVSKY